MPRNHIIEFIKKKNKKGKQTEQFFFINQNRASTFSICTFEENFPNIFKGILEYLEYGFHILRIALKCKKFYLQQFRLLVIVLGIVNPVNLCISQRWNYILSSQFSSIKVLVSLSMQMLGPMPNLRIRRIRELSDHFADSTNSKKVLLSSWIFCRIHGIFCRVRGLGRQISTETIYPAVLLTNPNARN